MAVHPAYYIDEKSVSSEEIYVRSNSHMVKKEEQFGSISGINISVLSPLRLKISIEYCALRTYSDVAGDSSLSDDTRHYNSRLKLGSSGSGNSLCKP